MYVFCLKNMYLTASIMRSFRLFSSVRMDKNALSRERHSGIYVFVVIQTRIDKMTVVMMITISFSVQNQKTGDEFIDIG